MFAPGDTYHYLLQHLLCTCTPAGARAVRAVDDAAEIAWIPIDTLEHAQGVSDAQHGDTLPAELGREREAGGGAVWSCRAWDVGLARSSAEGERGGAPAPGAGDATSMDSVGSCNVTDSTVGVAVVAVACSSNDFLYSRIT